METQWSEPTCPAPIDMYLLQVAVIPEGSQDPADAGILPISYNSTPPSSLYSSSYSKELLQFYRIATSPSVFFLVVPPLPSFPLFFLPTNTYNQQDYVVHENRPYMLD